jgi:hypothetical protein
VYGSPTARKANAESGYVAPAAANPTTASTSDGNDHGISRQILNPDGAKYDEQRFGTSTRSEPQASHLPEEREEVLASRMGDPLEDSVVKRQVL